jgi:hypothetical protein
MSNQTSEVFNSINGCLLNARLERQQQNQITIEISQFKCLKNSKKLDKIDCRLSISFDSEHKFEYSFDEYQIRNSNYLIYFIKSSNQNANRFCICVYYDYGEDVFKIDQILSYKLTKTVDSLAKNDLDFNIKNLFAQLNIIKNKFTLFYSYYSKNRPPAIEIQILNCFQNEDDFKIQEFKLELNNFDSFQALKWLQLNSTDDEQDMDDLSDYKIILFAKFSSLNETYLKAFYFDNFNIIHQIDLSELFGQFKCCSCIISNSDLLNENSISYSFLFHSKNLLNNDFELDNIEFHLIDLKLNLNQLGRLEARGECFLILTTKSNGSFILYLKNGHLKLKHKVKYAINSSFIFNSNNLIIKSSENQYKLIKFSQDLKICQREEALNDDGSIQAILSDCYYAIESNEMTMLVLYNLSENSYEFKDFEIDNHDSNQSNNKDHEIEIEERNSFFGDNYEMNEANQNLLLDSNNSKSNNTNKNSGGVFDELTKILNQKMIKTQFILNDLSKEINRKYLLLAEISSQSNDSKQTKSTLMYSVSSSSLSKSFKTKDIQESSKKQILELKHYWLNDSHSGKTTEGFVFYFLFKNASL